MAIHIDIIAHLRRCDLMIFYSPAELREMAEKAEAQAEVRESFYAFAARPGVQQLNTPDEFGGDEDD